ncbi:MAG: Flp family type IVb pilin [Candidatus Tyrphobacter sp.]
MQALRSLIASEDGVALAEYALALSLIAIGSMIALVGVAVACSATWSGTSTAMQTYSSGSPPP